MFRKFLPEEVVVELLLRLPVKSLVRFRCVSKRWLSLISDPRFAKSQFKRAADHVQRLLLATPSGLKSLEVDAPFGDSSAVRELFVPFNQPYLPLELLGSCDGLVLASHFDHKDFYIWNPSTGEHRKLPDPGISPNPDRKYMYGFGYDSSIDDYKVIVTFFLLLGRPSPRYVGKILSLKNNSWKRIKKPDDVFYSFRSAGALCGGAVHWLGEVLRPKGNPAILAFDLAEEKFRQVPMPPMLQEEDEDYFDIAYTCLVNLGGRLCLILHWDADHEELWGMMEYGVQKSWARIFRIDGDYCPKPLCMSRGNQLVAINDDGNVLNRVNPEGKFVESWVFGIEKSQNWHEPSAVFVETLLSPLFAF